MLSRSEYLEAQRKAAEMIRRSGIRITEEESGRVEVVDFGLGDLMAEGAQILTFFSTERVGAKVIALFPHQTLPEHWHPAVGSDPGKEETLRIVDGLVHFFTYGVATIRAGSIPRGKETCYTARHEAVMTMGDQITLAPGTKHWFRAGSEGAVLYSFSTCARDILDLFTDPDVVRTTKILD